MTKKRISPVQRAGAITLKPIAAAGDLPTPTEIKSAIDQVTEPRRRASDGRPKKEAAEGRESFNVRIKSDYIMEFKIRALRQKKSASDLLEEIIAKYLSE